MINFNDHSGDELTVGAGNIRKILPTLLLPAEIMISSLETRYAHVTKMVGKIPDPAELQSYIDDLTRMSEGLEGMKYKLFELADSDVDSFIKSAQTLVDVGVEQKSFVEEAVDRTKSMEKKFVDYLVSEIDPKINKLKCLIEMVKGLQKYFAIT